MTEEEEIAYLQQVERVTEEYFRGAGYDIDMSEMSTEELEQFFLRLPADVQTGLRTHLSMQLTGGPPQADVLDFSQAMLAPVELGGVPIIFAGTLAPVLKGLEWGGKVIKRVPILGWLGRALNIVDDAGDLRHAARAVTPAQARLTGATATQFPNRAAQAGRYPWSNVPPAAAGRTATGAGQAIPRLRDDALRATQLGVMEKVVGFGAAGAATLEAGRRLGEGQHPQREYTGGVEIVSEENKTQEQINREWMEDERSKQAETEPASVGAIIDANETGVMKQLYFEGLSETAAFDKLTNYIVDSGVHILSESGISLGAALEQQEASAGLGGALGAMDVVDLKTPNGQRIIRDYLKANWQRIDALKNDPRMLAAGGESGISGPVLSEEATVDTVIDQYMVGLQRNADFFLLAPENPDGTGLGIGIMTSFDGTTNGNVVSFNDMFSGGKIGPLNLLPELRRARPEQIAMWQQQLYAWGYLEDPPAVWGSIEPDAQGNMHTLDAAHRWQVAVFNEGVNMVSQARRASALTGPQGTQSNISLSDLITADGTPRADRVMDRAIARQMSGESTRATDARTMRDRVVAQAQDRVGRYLEATGRYLPEGSAMQIQSGLNQALSGLSAEDQESAFGQGGSPYERALAESILGKLYGGTGNWKDMLTFGTTNRDSSFFDYANRVGAVSERERDLLMAGVVNRGTYRDHWRDRHDQLKEAEADVAVAALLKFISRGMTGDFSTVTSTDIARGVNTYMHTIGAQQGLANPISESELTILAQEAIAEAGGARFQQNDQMLTDVATGGVDQMGLRGGVSGYQFRDLVNQLDSIQGVRKMGVPNA